jgi:hypothetical protein
LFFFFGAIVALTAEPPATAVLHQVVTPPSIGRHRSSCRPAVRRPPRSRRVFAPLQRCLCKLYAPIGFEYEKTEDRADKQSRSQSLFHQAAISFHHFGLLVIEAHQEEPTRPTRRMDSQKWSSSMKEEASILMLIV